MKKIKELLQNLFTKFYTNTWKEISQLIVGLKNTHYYSYIFTQIFLQTRERKQEGTIMQLKILDKLPIFACALRFLTHKRWFDTMT